MTDSIAILAFLDQVEQLERMVGEVYAAMAERFADQPELAATMRQLSQEEEAHARRVAMLRDIHLRDRQTSSEVALSAARLSEVRTEISALLRLARDHDSSLTIQDAFDLAAGLEVNLSDLHAEAAVKFKDEKTRAFFVGMAKADQAHARMQRARGGRANST